MPPQPRHEDDESRSDCSLYKRALIPLAALSIFMTLLFAAAAAAAVLGARRAARKHKEKQLRMDMKIDHFKMLLLRAESKVNCYHNLHGNLPQHTDADAASGSASAEPTTSRNAPAVPAPNYVPPVRTRRGDGGDAYCSGALQLDSARPEKRVMVSTELTRTRFSWSAGSRMKANALMMPVLTLSLPRPPSRTQTTRRPSSAAAAVMGIITAAVPHNRIRGLVGYRRKPKVLMTPSSTAPRSRPQLMGPPSNPKRFSAARIEGNW